MKDTGFPTRFMRKSSNVFWFLRCPADVTELIIDFLF